MDRNVDRKTGLLTSDPRASDGYTLYSPQTSSTTYLIDMDGQVVHRWSFEHTPGLWGQLLPNGNLLYAGNLRSGPEGLVGGVGGEVLEVDWDGNVVWSYEDVNLHHDVSRAPNGNTVVLGWEPVRPVIASQVRGGFVGTELDGVLWSDYINEISPDGAIVWEWHAQDVLDPFQDAICPLHERHEWTHANACTALPDGNILVSFRMLNTIGIVDRQTGGFLWKYTNIELGHQHDPTLLPNGNVLVFANGMHVPDNPHSRIFEIDPKTNEVVWRYESKPLWEFFSYFISGTQRLANGNTLICEGMTGRIFEVSPSGEILWDYVIPFFADHPRHGWVNSAFRARRYSPNHAAFVNKDLSPKGQ